MNGIKEPIVETESKFNKYVEILKDNGIAIPYITGEKSIDHQQDLAGSIERFIGYAQVPIGLAGPIRLRGEKGETEHLIPMATTEGALVASYNRGLKACHMSGGITSICVDESVQRSPYFKFKNVKEAIGFDAWINGQVTKFKEITQKVSRFAKLTNMHTWLEGNALHVTFQYSTGSAAGQNMTTIVTDMLLQYILKTYPVKPAEVYIEGNMSGDKKGNIRSLSTTRGKKVVAEVILPKDIVLSVLKIEPKQIVKFWQVGTLSAVQSGALGNHGHIVNAITAIYLACGQDVACVPESGSGIVRMEVTAEGDLYASLTMSGLIVGSIGGGTKLATQKESLAIIGCTGPDGAQKLAEVCCAVALAGELSIGAAISAGHFTQAHQTLGRK